MPENIYNKIYLVRGQKVMLDFDLAEIYGYTTSAFNRQVKRNIERFEGEDFMFRLTLEEIRQLSMCHFGTSISDNRENLMCQNGTSSWGGTRKLPYVFTEQGVYMLMTVLKGDLAVKQSRMLIQAFRAMKDYISENKILLDRRENFIANKVLENDEKIKKIDAKVNKITNEIADVIKKSEVSPVFLDLAKTAENREFLFLEGEAIRAKEAYMDIYKNAKKEIYIIDNYVSIKTLHLLQTAKQNLKITIYTDNIKNYLRKSDLEDFKKERPDLAELAKLT